MEKDGPRKTKRWFPSMEPSVPSSATTKEKTCSGCLFISWQMSWKFAHKVCGGTKHARAVGSGKRHKRWISFSRKGERYGRKRDEWMALPAHPHPFFLSHRSNGYADGQRENEYRTQTSTTRWHKR